MKITLRQINALNPITDEWQRLLEYQNKTKEDDELFEASIIVDSNGVVETLWLLEEFGKIGIIKNFALLCAKQVQFLLRNKDLIKAVDLMDLYLLKLCNIEALEEIFEKIKDVKLNIYEAESCAAYAIKSFISDDALPAVRAFKVIPTICGGNIYERDEAIKGLKTKLKELIDAEE